MAELADALRSGRSEGSLMWVQVPPSALQEDSLKSEFFVAPSPFGHPPQIYKATTCRIPYPIGFGEGEASGIIREN